MKVCGLVERTEPLFSHMRREGYAESYIRSILVDVRWLERNGAEFETYVEACEARMLETESDEMRRRYRLNFGILRRYGEDGVFPDRRRQRPLFQRGSYHELDDDKREVIDLFEEGAGLRGLKAKTVRGYASSCSCFLLGMQSLGRASIADVTESDVMGYFVGEDGIPTLSAGTKKDVGAVLASDLGERSGERARVAGLLPCLRTARRNVDYLRPDECEAVGAALSDADGPLSPRDRAMGSIMYYTGMRPVDVVGMRLADIDWARDRIVLTQEKTAAPLVLPLTAAIGNPIFEYVESSRPDTGDDHVFLGALPPHDPLSPSALYHVASRIYDAAGVRTEGGRRRGTHLFRYNVGTKLVGSGVPRPVASAVLGHTDPASLDHYLFADVAHLRGCALDVSRFPVAEGVYA
jgi:site-specific recombinase XerD